MAKQTEAPQQQPQLLFVERADAVEHFVDHVQNVRSNGQVVRVEFCATHPNPTGGKTRWAVTRVALSIPAAAELSRLLSQVDAYLKAAAAAPQQDERTVQ